MAINRISDFYFSQYYMQDEGGWCAGISVAMITHFYENLGENAAFTSPIDAYFQANAYKSLLRASYDKFQRENVMPSYRRSIKILQNAYERPPFFGGRGSYEYNFSSPGTAFLNLYVKDPSDDTEMGGRFDSRFSFSSGTSDHAGVAVWQENTAFLFDPNCGGMLYTWGQESFEAAADRALTSLYNRYDRYRGRRRAMIISAERLDPATLPYGRA